MAIQVTPLHPHIGAEVAGVDASRPLDDATLAALWRAIDAHSVLVLKDQSISDAQLKAFAAPFGPLEIGRSALQGGKRRLDIPEIGDISNLDIDNNIRARDDRRRLDMLGNRLWHTDASYMKVPVVLGMLFAVAVPPASALGAGETEFADMRAAYDALDDDMKALCEPLVVEHDIFWSRGQIGFTEFRPGEREKYRPRRKSWCAAIRAPGARRCTCRRMPRISSAGRWRMADCCCSTSARTRRRRDSFTAMSGRSVMW